MYKWKNPVQITCQILWGKRCRVGRFWPRVRFKINTQLDWCNYLYMPRFRPKLLEMCRDGCRLERSSLRQVLTQSFLFSRHCPDRAPNLGPQRWHILHQPNWVFKLKKILTKFPSCQTTMISKKQQKIEEMEWSLFFYDFF